MIYLINPPSPFLLDDKVHPPLGIMYLASFILENTKDDVGIIDLSGSNSWKKKLDDITGADIFGISSTTPQYGNALEIKNYLRDKYPESFLVVGGPHPTADPHGSINDGWDSVVVGEGEQAIMNIINNSNKRNSRGIYMSEPVEDLNTQPFPARWLMDLKSYNYKIGDRPATTAITSRSCPYSCAFCSKTRGSLRIRSAENVIAEVDSIQSDYGYNALMFYDDIFVMNYPRLEKIAKYMKKNDVIYRCFARANMVNDKIFELLGKTGCYEVGFGAETGSNELLKIANKKTTVEQNTELIRLAHKHGVRVKAFLIVGLPGETEETIKQTEDWIRVAEPDDFDITILTPYPGSDIYEHPEKYDIQFEKKRRDFEHLFYKGKSGNYTPMVSTKALSKERIVEARDEIERKWKRH